MKLERGIIHGGRVLSKRFDRVLRDPSKMWTAGRETRPRALPINLHVGHWTAGHCHEGQLAARVLFAAMESRKGKTGEDLTVSINFGITWDGLIFQFLDTRVAAAVHVGHRPTIKRSIGTECMWPGTASWARELGYSDRFNSEARKWGENTIECMPPSEALLDAWRWLHDALCDASEETNGDIQIPRAITAPRRRMPAPELNRFKGAAEHGNLPTPSTKIDACGYLLDAIDHAAEERRVERLRWQGVTR